MGGYDKMVLFLCYEVPPVISILGRIKRGKVLPDFMEPKERAIQVVCIEVQHRALITTAVYYIQCVHILSLFWA